MDQGDREPPVSRPTSRPKRSFPAPFRRPADQGADRIALKPNRMETDFSLLEAAMLKTDKECAFEFTLQ